MTLCATKAKPEATPSLSSHALTVAWAHLMDLVSCGRAVVLVAVQIGRSWKEEGEEEKEDEEEEDTNVVDDDGDDGDGPLT